MNHYVLHLIFSFLIQLSIAAQPTCTSSRYTTDLFISQVTQEPAIYATAPAIPAIYLGEDNTVPQDLSFDFYESMGDTLSQRPLIIMAFGGAFLGGSKRQAELVAYCEALARKGYCVASIDYRINFNVFSTSSSIRAVYRGLQDFRAAIRYFRHHADTYRVSPDHIYGGGNSAGAINALHAAYLDETDRTMTSIFAATFGSGNVPDLGCPDCSGNTLTESSTPDAVVNLWGGIGDIVWIEGSEAPVISFHGLDDTTVSPNTASPFGFPIFPPLSGSIPIHDQATLESITNVLHTYPGEGHELWSNPFLATEIIDSSSSFLFQMLRPEIAVINGSLLACTDSIAVYEIDMPDILSAYCWSVTNGVIVDSTASSIIIEWGNGAMGSVEVVAQNNLEAISESAMIDIQLNVVPMAHYSFVFDGPATVFTDASVGAVNYDWDFGDGVTSTLANPTHTYLENGNYNVQLTVTNACGDVSSFSNSITQQCQPSLMITQDPTPSGTYQAFYTVSSDHILTSNAQVFFKAGEEIKLENGFEVNLNDQFEASIEACVN